MKFTSCFTAVAVMILNGTSVFAATLFGGVSHSDVLAPVDPASTAPQQISIPTTPARQSPASDRQPVAVSPTLGGSARATIQNPAIEWFPIPKWMAGKWTKNGDLTRTVTDLRSGITSPVNQFIEDHMTVTWGYQTDSQGNIWHAHLIPSEREGVSQGKSVSFLIINLKVLEATPQNLATRTHYIVREMMGQQLTDIFQQESLTHYALVGADRMDAQSSNRVFTYQGQPKRDGAIISHYDKTSNFEPIASKQGVDLAASLNEYLRTHNMSGLAKQVQEISPAAPAGIPTQPMLQNDPLRKIDPNNPF